MVPGGNRSPSVRIMARRRLIFSAPHQPATAHPALWKWAASLEKGIPQHRGRAKVVPAPRMADQFSRKSSPRPWPRELSPANTMEATSTTGIRAVCQMAAASSRRAVV